MIQLNIASLSRFFDNKAECYKLFWFQAILNWKKKRWKRLLAAIIYARIMGKLVLVI